MAQHVQDQSQTVVVRVSEWLRSSISRRFGWGLLAVIVVAFVLWWFVPGLIQPGLLDILQDQHKLEEFVAALGWVGPLVLILFNITQIVVAPIPGYMVQLTAGFLYGPWWGGLWASCGLIVGALSAMWLARRYGRPLAARLVGAERLEQFESTTHSDHPLVWLILLASPIGDIPYFLAGLSKIPYRHIALLTLVIRVPTVFAWAAIGAGTVVLSWIQLALLLALLGLLLLVMLRYQKPLLAWLDRTVQRQIANVKREV